MVQQISALRVAADFDATKYTAGANAKVAADRAMIASAGAVHQALSGVGQAASATNTKISQSGNVIERLSRQYVDGYGSAARFESALRNLARGFDTGNLSAERADQILLGLNKRFGMMADASQIAARGQVELAAAVERANATIARQPPTRPVGAPQLPANQNNMGGLMAASQFQDIAITAAMGQSIPTIMLQQGSQLGAGLQMALGNQGAAGAAKMLGSALMSLFQPINLVAIGLTGVVAAGIQFSSKLLPSVKSIDEVLKEHEKHVKALADQWGEAANQRARYGGSSSDAVGFGFAMSTAQLRKSLREQVPDVLSTITSSTSANIAEIGGAAAFRQTELFRLLKTDINDMVQAAKDGSPDILGLTRRVAELGQASGNSGIRKLADDIVVAIGPVEELARKLLEANQKLNELFDNKGPGGRLTSQGSWARADMDRLTALNGQIETSLAHARAAFDVEMLGIKARSPADLAAAARAQAASVFSDESAPERRQRIELAGQRALIEAEHQLAEAQRDRLRSYDQTVASAQLDLDLIGKTAGEQAQLRMEFQLTAQLREEAARNGVKASESEIDAINRTAQAYGMLRDTSSPAQIAAELAFGS